ncbi:MAG: endonuclease/exonuclease/phosphatase family protein [Prolixibacteraceae bacterium]
MKIIKWVLFIVFVPVVLFGLYIVFLSFTNYSPDEQVVQYENKLAPKLNDTLTFSLLTWNIGYAGLDQSMDFFYDGGALVRPSKANSLRNLEGILQTMKKYHNADFLLLQEVDVRAKRSYRINQYETISHHFPDYSKSMGLNYNVRFVPMPPTEPLGKVMSGLSIFSKTEPVKSTRYSFPGNYSWPMSMVMLDRCFLVNEYPLDNGKKLMVINTHNSAYDNGSLRKQQMDFMKSILIDLYNQKNYVIAGGDWNQCPFEFIPKFENDIFDTIDLIYLDANYPQKDWTWAYDSTIPTNRRVRTPYSKGKTPCTVIDYFLCSPNIRVEKVNGRMLNFEYSDHQPVEITIKLL